MRPPGHHFIRASPGHFRRACFDEVPIIRLRHSYPRHRGRQRTKGHQLKEYKVLRERGRGFSEISPEDLEATLNKYAADGWRVVNTFSVFAVGRNSSIMTVLERDVS